MVGRDVIAAAALAGVLLTACGSGSSPPARPTPRTTAPGTATPTQSPTDLAAYAGVYRTAAGVVYLLSRSGLLVDTGDGSVHSVAVTAPGALSLGPSIATTTPPAGTVAFPGWHRGAAPPTSLSLTLAGGGGAIAAARLATTAEDVRIHSDDVELAATLTRPAAAGRLPAITIVHGSGRETRAILDLWTQLFVSLGFATLTYDKRGVGDSTGTYPGDLASADTLRLLAGDAAAAVAYLRTRPDVDPARVSLYGGSQGGWVLPLADASVHPALNIIASGPPVTVGQQGLFASLTGDGANAPAESDAAVDAQVAAEHGGYDPGPVLATDTVPTLWLFGAADLHVPTRVAVATLSHLARSTMSWRVFPRCSHSLLDTGTGLDADDAAATHFGAGLFAAIAAFTQQHGVATPTPPA